MAQQRKKELELYKLFAKDNGFAQAFSDAMKRMAGL
jgi:type I restriction enzyme R subunit